MLLSKISFQNVIDANGIWISITGISIVFAALIAITIILSFMPKIIVFLEKVYPESEGHHHAAPPKKPVDGDDEAIIAAIGFALHSHNS